MENNFATKVQTYQEKFSDIKEPREQFIIGCAYIDGYKEALKDVHDNLLDYAEDWGTISKVNGEATFVLAVKDIMGIIRDMKTDIGE